MTSSSLLTLWKMSTLLATFLIIRICIIWEANENAITSKTYLYSGNSLYIGRNFSQT